MNLPNLFLAGFAKCGTTFLHSILVQHESISGYKFKETNMFNIFDEKEEIYSFARKYAPINHNESYLIDSTVTYIRNHKSLNKIDSFCKRPKFILGVRNITDAIVSSHAQYDHKFDKEEVENRSKKKMEESISKDDYFFSDIKHLVDLFGAENVFVYEFSKIKDELKMKILIEKLQKFLDIEINTNYNSSLLVKNDSKKTRFKFLSSLLNMRFLNMFLKKVLPFSFVEALQNLRNNLIKINKTKNSSKFNIDEKLKLKLDTLYKRELEKIKSIELLNFYI